MLYLGDGGHAKLSRADLVRCYAQYDEAGLNKMAALLGYAYVAPETEPLDQSHLGGDSEVDSQDDQSAFGSTVSLLSEIPAGQTPFYRVVIQRDIEPDSEKTSAYSVPEEFTDADALSEELCVNQTQTPPQSPPLVPWSRLWPFLRVALGEQRKGRLIDFDQAVTRIAHGQQLQRLPHRSQVSWAIQAQVIIDLSERLLPFWQDFHVLCRALLRLRGQVGLQLITMPDGPASKVRDWHDANAPLRTYRLPPAGTSILILSDLGCFDQGGSAQAAWQCWLSAFRSRGIVPVALMPCPLRYWYPGFRQFVYPVCWDRGRRLPRGLTEPRSVPLPDVEVMAQD